MRIGVMLGIIVGLLGCGDVMSLNVDVDAGDGGMAGTTGRGGRGGSVGTGGGAGDTPVAGTGGAPPCVPDLCNTCVEGALTPKPDDTRCNTPAVQDTCDGVIPHIGQNGCAAEIHVCRSGVCGVVITNCCEQGGCPSGQKHMCSGGTPEDPTPQTYCTVCI